jgi:hypothetical protein
MGVMCVTSSGLVAGTDRLTGVAAARRCSRRVPGYGGRAAALDMVPHPGALQTDHLRREGSLRRYPQGHL